MKLNWRTSERSTRAWREDQLAWQTRGMRGRERFDLVMLGGVLLVAACLFVTALAFFLFGDRLGLLRRPLIEPLPDGRLLTNVHDDLSRLPLSDGVRFSQDGALFFSQQGGLVHRFDPATELWQSEQPFPNRKVTFSRLRAGNGGISDEDAGADEVLWGMIEGNGLARRDRQGWRMLFSETAFTDLDGKGFSTADLSSAAVSDDGRWLLLGTRRDGVGLYHIGEHRWVSRSGGMGALASGTHVSHVAFWKGFFWIGGPDGLFRLEPDSQSFSTVTAARFPIIDMDADPDGDLWLLGRKEAEACKGCVWFAHMSDPNTAPQILVDEEQVFPELSLADLQFAFQLRDHLVLAGKAGMFSYDLASRAWARIYDKRVTVAESHEDGVHIHFAGPGEAGVTDGTIFTIWPLEGETVRHLSGSPRGKTLALMESGRVYQLDLQKPPEVMFDSSSAAISNVFTNGVAIDDDILLLGNGHALLHDVEGRTYRNLATGDLPDWMMRPSTRLVHSGEELFLMRPSSNGFDIYSWPVSGLAGLARVPLATPIEAPPARSTLRDWEGKGLRYISASGQVVHFAAGNRVNITDEGLPELDGCKILDVAQWGSTFILATDRGLMRYDMNRRSWDKPVVHQRGHMVVELAILNGRLLMRTESERLLLSSDPGQLEGRRALIGGSSGFQIPANRFSDVGLFEDDQLLVAGDGLLEHYDLIGRRVTRRWELGDSPIELAGWESGAPLALAGRHAYWGEQELGRRDGQALALGKDSLNFWTLRDLDGSRYLKAYAWDQSSQISDGRCFFRNPTPGARVQLFSDALQLPSGLVLTATNDGLRLYSRALRSWYAGPQSLMARGGRLFLLGNQVIMEETLPNGSMVTMVPHDQIHIDDACSGSFAVSAESFFVRSLSVNESRGEAAWLAEDGSVHQWKAGQSTNLLAAAGAAPATRDLRGLFDRTKEDSVLFSTDDSIWRYNNLKREWLAFPLAFDQRGVRASNINLTRQGRRETVTAKTADGRIYHGDLRIDGGAVPMIRLYTPPAQTFGAAASELVDVQGRRNTLWTFLLADRIKFFDPRAREWLGEKRLPKRDSSAVYAQGAGLDVVTMRNGAEWLIAQDYQITGTDLVLPRDFATFELRPGESSALDSNRFVWRLKESGELLKSRLPENGSYTSFDRQVAEPVDVNPSSVLAAYDWDPLVVLVEQNRLRVFHGESNTEYNLGDAESLTDFDRVREFEGHLWLSGRDGLVRLARAPGDRLKVIVTRDVTSLTFDMNGTPWARIAGAWSVWDGRRFKQPWLAANGAALPDGSQLFVYEGAQITALDPAGYPHVWRNGFIPGGVPLLPATSSQTRALFQGLDEDWWVITDDSILQTLPAPCPAAGDDARCLQTSADWPLAKHFEPSAWAVARRNGEGDLSFILGDGERLRVIEEDDAYALRRDKVARPSTGKADVWPVWRDFVKVRAGRSVFNPIEKLATNDSGTLVAQRPSGELLLAGRGDVKLQVAEALDVGWLRWDRQQQKFVVKTNAGLRSFTREAFIEDGALLFEQVDDVVLGDGLFAANRHGIWHYPGTRLALDAPEVRYSPRRGRGISNADHDAFRDELGLFDTSGATLEERVHSVALHDVTLREDAGRVSGFINLGNRRIDAFAEKGFVWDGNRIGLVYDGDQLLLRSGAGFHPIDRLQGFDPGPDNTPEVGAARTDANGRLFLNVRGSWYRRDNGRWVSVTGDPFAVRRVIEGNWRWVIRDGELTVSDADAPEDFRWVETANGKAFAHDFLHFAAFDDGGFALMTSAGFELAENVDALVQGKVLRSPFQPVTSLAYMMDPDGQQRLFLFHRDKVMMWRGVTSGFVEGSFDPRISRPLVLHDRLQFHLDRGTINMKARLQSPAGGDVWLPISLDDGFFPFDRVTALATWNNELVIGSRAGLQVFTGTSASLAHARTFLDLRANRQGPLTPVTRMGVPGSSPGTLIVESEGLRLERHRDGPWQRSSAADLLKTRLRVATPFWRWTEQAGQLEGHYDDGSGTWPSPPIRFDFGRWPHDDLRDIATYKGKAVALWRNGWSSVFPSDELNLSENVVNLPAADVLGKRLLLVRGVGAPDASYLDSGLFLSDGERTFWRFSGAQWEPVTSPFARDGLRDFMANPPLYQADRLRLRSSTSLQFEHCALNGNWRPLPWVDGRVSIDRWRAFARFGNQIWAATPAGLVSFRHMGTRLSLDPDRFSVLRELSDTEAEGQVTELLRVDDRLWARVNQDSARIYAGTPDGTRDTRVFEPVKDQDPFGERVFISEEVSGHWRWEASGRKRGRIGSLRVTRFGEPVRFVDGRFDFDAPRSLALFQDGFMDLATEHGGWFRAPRDGFDLVNLRRVSSGNLDPHQVKEVLLGQDDNGPVLGLATLAGDYVRIRAGEAPQSVQAFLQYQGRDPLWRYERSDKGLVISARSNIGGVGIRELRNGRFGDDLVTGFPLALSEAENGGYLVPTASGVLRLDEQFVPSSLMVAPFPGFDGNGVPSVLLRREGRILYAAPKSFHYLEGNRDLVLPLNIAAPDNYVLEEIVPASGASYLAFWRDGTRRGFARLRDDDLATYPRNRHYVHLARLPAFIANRIALGDPSPWLLLDFGDEGCQLSLAERDWQQLLPLPDGFELVKIVELEEHLVLVGKSHLLRLNLNDLMQRFVDQSGS